MNIHPLQKAVEHCGGQTALAKAIGVDQGHIWYWLNKSKSVPAERCEAIERATAGKVTKHELRPDIFPTAEAASPPAAAQPAEDAA